jgi:hypothetical protein
VGDRGPLGDKGATGDAGATGEQGPIGDKGPTGEKGPTGDKGPIGVQGQSGPNLPCDNGCVTTPMIADLAVTNAKLAPISAPGKIANSATTATNANLATRIVARDGTGDVLAGVATASTVDLTGGLMFHAGSHILLSEGGGPGAGSIYLGTAAGRAVDAFAPAGNVGLGGGTLSGSFEGENTAVGLGAMRIIGAGRGNTVIGAHTMDQPFNSLGFNTLIGWRAGRSTGAARNIIIGTEAGASAVQSNNIYIDANGNDNNGIRIGNAAHQRTFIAGVENSLVVGQPVVVAANGAIGIVLSSERFKTDIRDLADVGVSLDDDASRAQTVVPLLVRAIQTKRAELDELRRVHALLIRRLEELERQAKR